MVAGSASAAEPQKPNILLFYADDLGYGELGCYGFQEVPTPHIDSIAANGIRFTSGYVAAPLCSPSRAGLMTGRYQQRFGHENNNMAPGRGLPATETTLAERLKTLGYATGIVGKWHLGKEPDQLPMKRGFDEYFGVFGQIPEAICPHQRPAAPAVSTACCPPWMCCPTGVAAAGGSVDPAWKLDGVNLLPYLTS